MLILTTMNLVLAAYLLYIAVKRDMQFNGCIFGSLRKKSTLILLLAVFLYIIMWLRYFFVTERLGPMFNALLYIMQVLRYYIWLLVALFFLTKTAKLTETIASQSGACET